jgi:hypothetical protein
MSGRLVSVEVVGASSAPARRRRDLLGRERGPLVRVRQPRLRLWRQLMASGASPELSAENWLLGTDDVPHLLSLVRDKFCEYQTKARRDLFCVAATKDDRTADKVIDGRRAAPTSRALCRACSLPSTDYICSHLLHPGITAITTDRGVADRRAIDALCDQARTEVAQLHPCHAGGHECWQRLLDVEALAPAPISPLTLPESFDTLDAMWRLAFGKKMRLVSLTSPRQ